MTNLIKLEKKLLAHDFQGTDFACILLLSQENLPISALPDLRQNLKVALPQPCAPLPEVGSFASEILGESLIVFRFGGIRRWRVLCFELCEPILASVDV